MAMSFSVRATPSNLVSYPELCCLRTRASTQASTLTHSGEPVREELRRQEALQLGGAGRSCAVSEAHEQQAARKDRVHRVGQWPPARQGAACSKRPPLWQRPSAAPATPQPLVILGGLAIPWGGEEAGPLPARASRLPKPRVPPPLTMQAGRCRPRSSRAMMRCRPTGGPTTIDPPPHMAAVPLWGTGELRGYR